VACRHLLAVGDALVTHERSHSWIIAEATSALGWHALTTLSVALSMDAVTMASMPTLGCAK